MANETLITDLVAQEALDQLEQLDRAMEGTLQQFKDCAMELAKGIKIPVEVHGDLDRLRELANTTMQRAGQAAQQYTQQLQQQQQVIANTTNTISRQLAEQEKLNKTQREAFTQNQRALDIAENIVGTYEQNTRQLAQYTAELARNKEQLKEVEKQRKNNQISSETALQRSAALMAEQNKLKAAMQEVASVVRVQAKEMNAAEGSYVHLSQQLELLKKAQKGLNEEEKAGEEGRVLEAEIQNLDARLKDLAADMGEFQRNVGNYAVAANNMKGTLRQLTEEIAQLTLQYQELSDEEQRSDVGMQMRDKITQLTEEAGKYRDIVSDVKQSISASASDTRLFDSLIEAGQVFAATMGVAETACRALGMSEESLQKSMLKVQQAMQAVQALQVIQNTLQKQSNLMKGIAILQSKAAAAAARIEAAATASATGATKAQTVAQAAFNAVAKANPYVLLATAILAVIGLIVGYTSATEDATEADEAANEQREKAIELEKQREDAMKTVNDEAYKRKKVEAEMASTVANSVSKQLANYTYLQKKWKECGDDVKLQQQFLNDYKTEIDNTGFAIKNVYDAHNVLVKQAPNVINMYYALAEAAAAAAVAEEAFKRKIERQAKGSVENGGRYYTAKSGTKFGDLSKEEQDFLKSTGGANASQNPYLSKHDGFWESYWGINDAGVEQINKFRNQKALELRKSLDDADDAIIKYANDVQSKAEKVAKDLQGEIGTAFNTGGGGGGGGSTNKRGGRGRGGSGDKPKEFSEVEEADNKFLLDAINSRNKLIEEYSDEWIEKREEAIAQQAKIEKAANKKRYEQLDADLEASHNAKKMSDKKYEEEKAALLAAYEDIDKGIDADATKRKKELADEVLKHKQELAQKEIEEALSQGEAEQVMRDAQYANELEALKDKYAKELAEAEGNEEKIAEVKKRYQEQTASLSEQYAIKTAKAQYDLVIKQLEAIGVFGDEFDELTEMVKNGELDAAATTLEAYGLTHDQALDLLKSLAEAEIGIRTATTDAIIAQVERESEANQDAAQKEKEAHEKKMQNLQDWVQRAGEAIEKISGFVTALYDNQIAKIEELLEAEQEQYDKEVENIEYLAERGAITSEEAEIRKRDAAAATAAKQEQLEKKKAQLEYKKAVMEKANTIAQIGIATALGIMQALAMWPPNIPLSVFVGTMGAIQVATALAQPIKAYKEGTKGKPHPGGLALVGEGGTQELVMYNGNAWVTPDKPTLLDLPKGAEVFPQATMEDLLALGASLPTAVPRDRATGQPIVINDYSALESRIAANTKAVTKALREHQEALTRQLKRQKFNAYIARRI